MVKGGAASAVEFGLKNRPSFPQIPEFRDVIVGELATNGDWIVANVQTDSYWPVTAKKMRYRGEDVWILPLMKGFYPSIAMKVPPGNSRDECAKLLMRFLSTLSWVEKRGFTVEGFSGGNLPRPIGREKTMGVSVCEELELQYFPEPEDERAMLALALMREGRALHHPAYAFLSFYRVLEVALSEGKLRGSWIDEHIEAVADHRAKEAIVNLRLDGVGNIGTHLYRTNRQAIAHAAKKPIVDPDDPSHDRRLWAEMPIIAGLAELAIEQIFGIETSSTVYARHLYELAGFKQIFGPELIAQITSGDKLEEAKTLDIPIMNVQIQGKAPYGPLTNMTPVRMDYQNGMIHLVLKSPDKRGQIGFRLDFFGEQLHFELSEDLIYSDDGTPDSAEAIAELKRFFRDYFGNGQLHIYNADTGALISRKDAFIPVNMWLDFEASEHEIAYWRKLADLRRHCEHNGVLQWADPYFLSVAVSFDSPGVA